MRHVSHLSHRLFRPAALYRSLREALSSWWPLEARHGRHTRARPKSHRRALALETMEPRLLLSADLSYVDNGNNDSNLTLTFDSGSSEYRLITSSNTVVSSADVADAANGGIVITGTSGNDSLTVDLPNLTSATLTFLGQGEDTLRVTGDVDFVLSASSLTAGNKTFSILNGPEGDPSFESIAVTGGASANKLTIDVCEGAFSFDGVAGVDNL